MLLFATASLQAQRKDHQEAAAVDGEVQAAWARADVKSET